MCLCTCMWLCFRMLNVYTIILRPNKESLYCFFHGSSQNSLLDNMHYTQQQTLAKTMRSPFKKQNGRHFQLTMYFLKKLIYSICNVILCVDNAMYTTFFFCKHWLNKNLCIHFIPYLLSTSLHCVAIFKFRTLAIRSHELRDRCLKIKIRLK